MALPGVGRKVADCVALFSLNKLEALPVDTHVIVLSQFTQTTDYSKVWQIAKRYMTVAQSAKSLNDKVYKEVGDFFLETFGDKCGWAHTVLFYGELAANRDKLFNNTPVAEGTEVQEKRRRR